jgi:ABC-type polysaccharide/polyol phosphate transport system ATPase subunit
MSDSGRLAIRLRGVGKLYKLFARRRDHALDAAGLGVLLRWRGITPRMFWALRDIDLDVAHGKRIGIVGRNGAGKSTLLKVITGALAPTEGIVDVDGRVQALFEAGSGFHPEFTGYENIDAALTYQGLDQAAIQAAIEDIAEFTELGDFLAQPLKTYSLGMQARLAFAVATATRPSILIVDEVLGAGDAYFASKSSERMRALVEQSGATVLLVSHDTSALLRYCEECLWVERGRIAQRGRALDVVNAYQAFIREMEDRRLRARNRRRSRGSDPVAGDASRQILTIALQVDGPPGSGCEVADISLLKGGLIESAIHVGEVQDASSADGSAVSLPGSRWSEPRTRDGRACRTLLVPATADGRGHGEVTIAHEGTLEDGQFSVRFTYRAADEARLSLAVQCDGAPVARSMPLAASADWREVVLDLERTPVATVGSTSLADAPGPTSSLPRTERRTFTSGTRGLVRWPSEGSLTFERVALIDPIGRERAIFEAGTPFCMRLELEAHRSGRFNLILAATVDRLDGIFITNLISPPMPVVLAEDERVEAWLEIPRLPLGDARYIVSLSAFEGSVEEHTRYDLLARAFEFEVTGNSPLTMQAVVQLDAHWRADAAATAAGGSD